MECLRCKEQDEFIERVFQADRERVAAGVYENDNSCARCHKAKGWVSVSKGEPGEQIIICQACIQEMYKNEKGEK